MEMQPDSEVLDICRRVDGWDVSKIGGIAPLDGGYTNRNYSVEIAGEMFALRVGGDNAAMLGIDRNREREILARVSAEGLCPEVVAFMLPEGHMVSRFVEGVKWEPEEFRSEPAFRETARILRSLHQIEPVGSGFSPYDDIRSRIETARKQKNPLPDELPEYLSELDRIEDARTRTLAGTVCLCHNDPFATNFLHNGTVWLLDWEYAGDGDPLYDVASTCLGCDTESTRLFLEYYHPPATDEMLTAIEDQRYVVRFWNGMWALLQRETAQANASYDYDRVVSNVFAALTRHIEGKS